MSRFKKRLRTVDLRCATSVQNKSSTGIPAEDLSRERIPAIYCPGGDSAGVSSVPTGDSVVVGGASVAAGLRSVAAGAVVGAGVAAGLTFSVFCSQSARRAAPAIMQMYFFIVGDAYCFNRSIASSAVFRPRKMFR